MTNQPQSKIAILVEGGTNGKKLEVEWSIFKINTKGKILKERSPELNFTIKNNKQTHTLKFKGKYNVTGGHNLAAYQLLDPKLTINTTSNTSLETIDHSIWNKNQQLLWLKNHKSIRVVQSNGNIVYQQFVNMDFHELPVFFDGKTTWWSDKNNGLKALTLEPNYFQIYQYQDFEFDNSTRGIYAAKDGRKWMSTINATVKLNASNQRVPNQPSGMLFTPFLKDKSNNLWCFENGKLLRENLATGEKTHFGFSHITPLMSWSLFQSKKGDIWSFSPTGEIYALNPTDGEIKQLAKLPIPKNEGIDIYYIQQRNANQVWFCTSRGLYVVDNEGQYIAQYNKQQEGKYYLPTSDIHHLYLDKSGVIWLATGDAGLLQLTMDNGQLTVKNQYTTENGLSCNILARHL